jgi:hypothetical protein
MVKIFVISVLPFWSVSCAWKNLKHGPRRGMELSRATQLGGPEATLTRGSHRGFYKVSHCLIKTTKKQPRECVGLVTNDPNVITPLNEESFVSS